LRPAFAGEGGSLPLCHPAATFLSQHTLRAAKQSALGAGRCQSFACALGDKVSLDLGEQAEQGNHNLGLQVLLSLEVDAFLDGSEADFTLHQFIDDVNHLSQATPETR